MVPSNRDRSPEKRWLPVTVRFRKVTLDALRQLARQKDCPQSYLIREAVEQLLREAK